MSTTTDDATIDNSPEASVDEAQDNSISAPSMPALQGTPAPNIGQAASVMPNPQSPGSPEEQEADAEGSAPTPRGGSGSLWENILMGALGGLAGQTPRGRSSIANGAIEGAKGGQASNQQQFENQQAAQKLQIQQTQQDDEHQIANARLAYMHTQQHMLDTQYANMPKNMQDVIDQESQKQGALLESQGNQPINGGDHVGYTAAKNLLSAQMSSDQTTPFSNVMTKNTDGTFNVYHIGDPTKMNTAPIDVTTGYHMDDKGNPVFETTSMPAGTVKISDALASHTAVAARASAEQNAVYQKKQEALAIQSTPEGQADIALKNAQADKAERDNSADKQSQQGITEINNASTKGKDSYANFAAENNTFKDTLTAAKSGDEVASNFAKTMGIMSVNKIGDLSRISPQEYAALGPDLGSVFRQGQAILSKAGSGQLPDNTVKELSALQQRVSDIKYASYLSNMQLIAQNRGMDTSKVMVLSQDGKTPVQLSNAKVPQQPITVTDPKGGVHTFPNQAAADAFKKAAGIQ
jgi:hypothetical protein